MQRTPNKHDRMAMLFGSLQDHVEPIDKNMVDVMREKHLKPGMHSKSKS